MGTNNLVKAVIFDLDDTLYSEAKYISKAYKKIAQKVAKEYGEKTEELYNYLLNTRKNEGDRYVLQRLMKKYCNINNSVAENYIKNILVPIYRNIKCDLSLYDDAKKTLNFLYKNNIALGLITNGGPDTQWNKIEQLNIKYYFSEIIVTGEYFKKSNWKPSSKPFKLCCSKMNLKSSKCIYVGNDPKYDVKGAKKANYKDVYIISRDYNLNDNYEIDFKIINSLITLIELFKN